jgi:hypothetical protein
MPEARARVILAFDFGLKRVMAALELGKVRLDGHQRGLPVITRTNRV